MTKTETETIKTETKDEIWARTARAFALRTAREHRRTADRILDGIYSPAVVAEAHRILGWDAP